MHRFNDCYLVRGLRKILGGWTGVVLVCLFLATSRVCSAAAPVPPELGWTTDGVSAPDATPWPLQSVPQILGAWSFDQPDLSSGFSDGPWLATNAVRVPSPSGWALKINSPAAAAVRFSVRQSNTNGDFSVRNGSVAFWFRPTWSSGAAGAPTVATPLVEVGAAQPSRVGWWALQLGPAGKELSFLTQSGGQEALLLKAPVNLTSNAWSHLALTWSPTNSTLYLNGQRITNGLGVTRWPGLSERERWGWGVGGDGTGLRQIRGEYDTLLTFNHPLSGNAIAHLAQSQITPESSDLLAYAADSAGGSTAGPSGLWLQPFSAPSSRSGWLHGTQVGLKYEVFGAEHLSGPWELELTFPGQDTKTPYELPVDVRATWFILAAAFSDQDGDGLSDEYERRVSLTSGSSVDTDQDGMPDGWEVAQGLNPRLATDAEGDPDQDGFPSEMEYRLGRNPQLAEAVPIVSVSGSATDLAESVTEKVFVVQRTGSTVRPLEVFFELRGAAANGGDYAWVPNRITIPAGATKSNVAIRPINDTLDEAAEPITLDLIRAAEYGVGTASATMNLLDDDLPMVSIRATDSAAREPGWTPLDPGEVEIRREGQLNAPLKVNLKISGTAVAATDYTSLPLSVTFPAGEVVAKLAVVPKDNGLVTGPRTVNVAIETSPTYQIQSEASLTAVTIEDAQPAVVTVVASDPLAREGATPANPAAFKFTRTGSTARPLTVFYRVGGTAQSQGTVTEADYPPLPGSVVIPAGSADLTVTVTPYADTDLEMLETVTVVLTGSLDYTIGTASSATAQIDDSSTVKVASRLVAGTSSIGAGPFAEIEVTRLGSTASELTVPVTVVGQRLWQSKWYPFASVPAAAGASYGMFVDGQPAVSVKFPPGVARRTLTVKAMHPAATVPAASITIGAMEHALKFVDAGAIVSLGTTASHVTEGGSGWTFTVTPGGPSPVPTIVQLRLQGDISSSDFTVTGATLASDTLTVTIPSVVPGSANRQVTVRVTPKDDKLPEVPSEHLAFVFDRKQTGAALAVNQHPKPYVAVRVADIGDAGTPALDVDRDHLPDSFELEQGLNPLEITEHVGDLDRDGIGDREEYIQGTNPKSADTDSDGLSDFVESMLGLNPLKKDTQGIALEPELVPIRLRTAGAFRQANNACYRCHAPEMKVGDVELSELTATSGGGGQTGLLERTVLLRAGTTHTVKLSPPDNYTPTTKGQLYDAEILPVSSGPPGFVIMDPKSILGRSLLKGDQTFTETATLRVLARPRLGVDANRDGFIRFDGSDATTPERPYRFWVNNDSDIGELESIPPSTLDNANGKIVGVRDVEDLSRLWIALDGMDDLWAKPGFRLALEWRRVRAGSPAIQIFNASAWRTGERQYLNSEEGARDQAGLVIPGNEIALADEVSKAYTLKPGVRLVLPPKSMDITRMQSSRRHLVFEGAAAGQGELVVMLLQEGQVVVESAPLHLRLMDVKEMYQRAQAGPVDGFDAPYKFAETEPPTVSCGVAPWRPSFALDPDPSEEPTAAVFVHGWNMSEEEAVSFSETMFKRLWHVGFKGRFASFRWPTHVAGKPNYPDSFNVSEHRALEYGASLKMFSESLPSSYSRNILAHSMGGVVTTSALRYGMKVRNVLLMQAAISAGVFDESRLLNWSDLVLSEAAAETWLKTPDDFRIEKGYRGYLENTGAKIVNYCNDGDFALQTGEIGPVPTNWIANQQLQKPHWPGLSDYRSYLWKSEWINAGVDTRFRYGFRNRPQKILRFVSQVNEIQAFIARSRTRAVGAEPRTGGHVNVGEVRNLREQPFNFRSSRPDHSGQFERALWFTWEFYLSLLSDLGV